MIENYRSTEGRSSVEEIYRLCYRADIGHSFSFVDLCVFLSCGIRR